VSPYDLEVEEAVLGSVLMAPSALPRLVGEIGLRPHHFYREQYGQALEAMLALHDRGAAPDLITLAAELNKMGVDNASDFAVQVAGTPINPANVGTYARRVIELFDFRRIERAGQLLRQAGESQDHAPRIEAERILEERSSIASRAFTPDQLADLMRRTFKAETPEVFPWPFARLNQYSSGGMRRGEFTLIGGWTSHGKSVFLDDCLKAAQRHRRRVALYINEMTPQERLYRLLADASGVEFARLREHKLGDDERRRVDRALESEPFFAITDATEWTAEEIKRDIIRCRYDVVGVDILHEIDHDDEADLRRIVRRLSQAAKRGNCHVLATVHLNEFRATTTQRPRPALRDIRGSGMLKNAADFVLFVWRQDDENGIPTEDGAVYFSKARNARLGGLPVRLNGDRMRFEVRA
jgi:replicative DNA helicase